MVAASALRAKGPSVSPIELFVPENGFIALHAPLTRRRIGSHSTRTRTTHPEFLGRMQPIFNTMNLPVRLENPYRHMTKGEMLLDLAPDEELEGTTVATVSCAKWKRKSQQSGHCVPCLIRRAAFAKAGITDTTAYQYKDIGHAWDRTDIRYDIMAMLVAVGRNRLSVASAFQTDGKSPQ
ncbi:7-cyano-7-deazaguanine synthase [Kaistia terrae]|uniref:7-cyano-7-deazaguanine synthase n=1 Tax=Kaistia terrae TaxID=537017 RepID=A0ABW0Q4D2_9HYPH|nr:7-cyano-7-deazaguanine synthase [Kaistia terrae]MCX5581747.1 7-cyano-7-deazaguanine synthase [Kaistia terrae]